MASYAQPTTAAVLPVDDVHKQPASSARLEDQAAIAALYVTNQERNAKNGQRALGDKSSSAGAGASLKYANPQDLPSFPSSGLKDDSAAGAAASLGWANQKSFEHWKPETSASAAAAALHAKDYKMAPLWQPEQSSNGAKAALLAHRDGGKVDVWRPEASSWGNTAANQAFKKDRAGGLSPQPDSGHTPIGRHGSLLAATGAMSGNRRRADSTPTAIPKPETYPDEANATANALSAATSASKPRRRVEGGSVAYTNMPREMYTSNPPVAPEVEEQQRADVLRASAVAMAKQMYSIQQKETGTGSSAHHGARVAHGRQSSMSTVSDEVQQPMRFTSLQEAAQKLAQQRLAKLYDEHSKNQEYREYYGSSPQQSSRLSIRGRTRRRASSDGKLDEDREQSNKIRAQMSIFSTNVSQIDAKKRQQDREALIAAAQRNVAKSLHGIDEKVFAETGKVSPSLLSEWEVKAHAAAQAKSDIRMENYGKVNIGGGVFINQSAIDLVAARNVQPVLDEINEKAEQERVRQAELKLDQENNQRKAAEKKAREKEVKEVNRKLKQQDKEEEKAKKAEEKAAKNEEKRLAKEKRKSGSRKADAVEAAVTTDVVGTDAVGDTDPTTMEEPGESSPPHTPARMSMEDQERTRVQNGTDAAKPDESVPVPSSPPQDGSKVRNWLKTKFSRRLSKGQNPPETKDAQKASPETEDVVTEKAFIGGAALTGANANENVASSEAHTSSIRDVALAGNSKEEGAEMAQSPLAHGVEGAERSNDEDPNPLGETSVHDFTQAGTAAPEEPEASAVAEKSEEQEQEQPAERGVASGRPESEVSSVSAMSTNELETEDDDFQEARDNFDEGLAPPPTFPAAKGSTPTKDSRFHEDI